jgi:hypothetical protein
MEWMLIPLRRLRRLLGPLGDARVRMFQLLYVIVVGIFLALDLRPASPWGEVRESGRGAARDRPGPAVLGAAWCLACSGASSTP